MGPRQVGVCELADNHDGTFRLGIRPKEAGRHVLQIKYGGEHVQGNDTVKVINVWTPKLCADITHHPKIQTKWSFHSKN